MSALAATDTRPPRFGWVIAGIQLLLVSAYAYAVVAYLASNTGYFPEQAPPGWSWPAVVVVGIGYIPAAACLIVAVPAMLALSGLRADRPQWFTLGVTSAASAVMLAVMATPPGWELFDWYVS